MNALANVAHKINLDLASRSAMQIGERIMHPDGYLVEVISGQYLDAIYHRVSNFWYWKRVNSDGTLCDTVESGYGWNK